MSWVEKQLGQRSMIEYKSGTKPRYDNKGSEFGNMHRELPKYCGMFDIDRMSAVANVSLELTNTETAFMEYRTDFNTSSINFLALFEIKHKESIYVTEALKCKVGTSTWAQMQMCKTLNCRYFIVVANSGIQPFNFYEIDLSDGRSELVYVLDYGQENKRQQINKCWQYLGLLD